MANQPFVDGANQATGASEDNRFQWLNVAGGDVSNGSVFTILGVNDSNSRGLQVFRVVETDGANRVKITPAIIVGQSVDAPPANGAAIIIKSDCAAN